MSGLFAALNSGVKALTAQSVAVETAGRNLANVNNANYARQRVVFGDRGVVETPHGPQSLGLEALGVEQLRDRLLDQQVVRALSLKAQYEAEQAGYQNAQAGLGESIDRSGETDSTGSASNGTGVNAALANFFSAFQSFASSPTDPGERQTLLQQSGVLVDRIRSADARLTQVQSDLTTQATTDIAEANTIIDQIAELNDKIAALEINRPGAAIDLRDQRQTKLEELAKKINFEVQEDPAETGRIRLFARDGASAEVNLVNYTSRAGAITLTGSTISAGTPSTALNVTGGAILGSIKARDEGVQDLRDSLDELAEQLVTAVNDAYNPLGTATEDFFTSTGTTAATLSLDSNLNTTSLKSSNSTAVGDNTLAQAVADLGTQVFDSGSGDVFDGTFAQHFSKAVSNFGQTLATTNSNVSQQTTVETLVRSRRDSISGVSLDEEMADLLKYQRSFQASSRVIQVIDELLETIVTRLGV